MTDDKTRPDYFATLDEELETLLRVKGNLRRSLIAARLEDSGLQAVPDAWRLHDLPAEFKEFLGAQHPQARGGEDLPNLHDGEVEIARMSLLDSVHGEVFSLRAKIHESDGTIGLRLVDEYESGYRLEHAVLEQPLIAPEVLEVFRNASPSPLDTSCRVGFASYFYDGLDELAQQMGIDQVAR